MDTLYTEIKVNNYVTLYATLTIRAQESPLCSSENLYFMPSITLHHNFL